MKEPRNTRTLNDRQRLAVQGVAQGLTNGDAGIRAGYSPKTAYSHVQRLLKNVEAKLYLKVLREKSENDAVLSLAEKRKWLADKVRNPAEGVDPIRAMQEDSKLAGHYSPEKSDVTLQMESLFENVPENHGLGR